MFIPKTKRSEYFIRNYVLKDLIRKTIKSSTQEESKYWLCKINHFRPYFKSNCHRRFIKSINKNYEHLTRFFNYDCLDKNTNLVENLIRQFNRKIKNMDGFKSENNLNNFIKLWFNFYHEKHKISHN